MEWNEYSHNGWKIRFEKTFDAKSDLRVSKAQRILEADLTQISFSLPEKALEKVRQIPITVLEKRQCLQPHAFHIDPAWLKENCKFTEKMAQALVGSQGTVILSDVEAFLDTRSMQPSALLHELSHGFLAQLESEPLAKELMAAYEKAKKSGKYKKVLHYYGKKIDAYALTDIHEYFAEGSESYFGTNEFYPFVRPELKLYDPDLFRVLVKIWEDESSSYHLRSKE